MSVRCVPSAAQHAHLYEHFYTSSMNICTPADVQPHAAAAHPQQAPRHGFHQLQWGSGKIPVWFCTRPTAVVLNCWEEHRVDDELINH